MITHAKRKEMIDSSLGTAGARRRQWSVYFSDEEHMILNRIMDSRGIDDKAVALRYAIRVCAQMELQSQKK